MKTCPNCGKNLDDNMKFCDGCGTQVAMETVCPNCGVLVPFGSAICPNCGAPVGIPQQPVKNRNMMKKLIIFGGIGIVVVAAIVITVLLLLSGGKKVNSNYAVYIKDEEIFLNDLKNGHSSEQITSRLFSKMDLTKSQIASSGYSLGYYTYVSDDGKYIFFPDKLNSNDDGVNLYYKKVGGKNSEAVKIDSDITSYQINTSGTIVTYMKNGNLYQYKMKQDNKEKIAEDVSGYRISETGTVIYYYNSDYDLYMKRENQDKEKIAGEITSIVYCDDNFSTIYYKKDDSLYKKAVGKEKEKIASDISSVIKVYENGEMYYVVAKEDEVALYDFAIDDLDEDGYYKDYLESTKIPNPVRSLYYYNGKASVLITDSYYTWNDYSAKNTVLCYESYNMTEFEKIELSDLDSVYDFSDKLYERLAETASTNIAIKDKSIAADLPDDAEHFYINESGTVMYYIQDDSDLYRVMISGNSIGKPESYDTDVYEYDMDFISDTQFMYYKEYEDGSGDLYVNKELVDYDVYVTYYSNVTVHPESKNIYYYTDYNTDKGEGVLKCYTGGKSVKISDDVYSFTCTYDGRVLYLYDYSTNSYTGELKEWNNGKDRKIDEDVAAIIPLYLH